MKNLNSGKIILKLDYNAIIRMDLEEVVKE